MAKIIEVEKNEEYTSYKIDFGDDMVLWFDTHHNEDGELTGDWNQYIFHTDNERDMQIKAFQEAHNDEVGAYNFMTALETCEQYVSNIKQQNN